MPSTCWECSTRWCKVLQCVGQACAMGNIQTYSRCKSRSWFIMIHWDGSITAAVYSPGMSRFICCSLVLPGPGFGHLSNTIANSFSLARFMRLFVWRWATCQQFKACCKTGGAPILVESAKRSNVSAPAAKVRRHIPSIQEFECPVPRCPKGSVPDPNEF